MAFITYCYRLKLWKAIYGSTYKRNNGIYAINTYRDDHADSPLNFQRYPEQTHFGE